MGNSCSICRTPEIAETVNQLLLAGQPYVQIAASVHSHRSSVSRHKRKCFGIWKAAKLAAKKAAAGEVPSRFLMLWPAGFGPDGPRDESEGPLCMWNGQPFDIADRQRGDCLLRIQFEHFDALSCKNPGALIHDAHREALEEDQRRRRE